MRERDVRGLPRRAAVGGFLAMTSVARVATAAPAKAGNQRWRSLWNGRDLAGWERWLGVPHESVTGLSTPRGPDGKYLEPVGLNQDPLGVYSVAAVDGAPAIRISGQIYGALTTLEEFQDFHLRLEFKWGEKKWQPRTDVVRDSGLLYFCHGEHGYFGGKAWMRSLELQIQERDVGDYWGVGPVACEIQGTRADDIVTYARGAQAFPVPGPGGKNRAIKGADAEKPTGAWNVVELYAVGDAAVHVVNGKQVLAVSRARRREGEKLLPLTRGRLQLQSEGAEVFYRNIAVRPLRAFPAEYRP